MDVVIDESLFTRIMMCMGYPVTPLHTISNGMMTPKQIRELLIWPALQDYFKFFPLEEQVETYAAGNFRLPFPDEWVFGLTDCRAIARPVGSPCLTANPFVNDMFFRTGRGRGSYGSRFDYELGSLRTMERMEAQANIESFKSLRIKVNEAERYVEGYTTTAGRLLVTWARLSNDASKVTFHYQQDFVRLAQSYVKEFFGMMRQQSAAQLPTDLSGDTLVESAKALREEVLTSWKAATKVIILRN